MEWSRSDARTAVALGRTSRGSGGYLAKFHYVYDEEAAAWFAYTDSGAYGEEFSAESLHVPLSGF